MRLSQFIIATLMLKCVNCAKILAVFPAPGYSQFILAEALMRNVVNRGHQVTVISPYSPEDAPPNYKTIKTYEVLEGLKSFDLFALKYLSLFENIMSTYHFGNAITEMTFNNREVQKLIQSNEQFDLVIVEHFFNDAMKAFARHFKAPLILFSSMGLTEWNGECMGTPSLPTINAVTYTGYTNHMNFFQRTRNAAGMIFDYIYRKFVFYPIQKKYMEDNFPNKMVFEDVINDATLMFLNSHVTTSENALLPFNMIEIGGFHVIPKTLDKTIQDYLDNGKDGVILFSLGSNLKSADLSEDTVNAILKVFGKLKQRVLWKFEKQISDKPQNVYIAKWLKQSDILAHPNTKLFITHGGMLSTTEAISHGVPMIGIPVFGDQAMNMARARNMGIANVISLDEMTEKNLFDVINQAVNNITLQENAKKMSALMKDRPIKPLDLAMYWIEYVIRHKGVRFELGASKLYWFELYMVDMTCFFLVITYLLFLGAKILWKFSKKNRINRQSKKIKIKNQ